MQYRKKLTKNRSYFLTNLDNYLQQSEIKDVANSLYLTNKSTRKGGSNLSSKLIVLPYSW